MATSITAIEHGLDYQAYLFWTEAARLLVPTSCYASVGFELEGIKSLDDVATFHAEKKSDCRGNAYDADYYQVKYHVDYRAQITGGSLIDPAFIGATSASFLKKVKEASEYSRKQGKHPRLFLFTPWTLDPNDVLASLVGGGEGELRLEKIMEGGERSDAGKLRKLWREHLSISSDKELIDLLHCIRIQAGERNFQQLKKTLNDSLNSAGLEPIDETKRTDPYPQLIRKLRAEGKSIFDAQSIRAACEKENLIRSAAPLATSFGRRLGIRSFFRFAENMECETDRVLSLLQHFDGRPIKSAALWRSEIVPAIKSFINSELSKSPKALEFHLDTHLSCAVAAGYFMDPKAGVDVAVLQKTMSARQLWINRSEEEDLKKPRIGVTEMASLGEGIDEAFAISITQMTFGDVVSYAKQNAPSISRIQRLEIASGAGNTRVESGGHATALAEQIRNLIKERRTAMKDNGRIHLFISAPNAVAFFLGRILNHLGPIQLYEHNFDGSLPTSYVPSIELSKNI